MIRFSGGYRFFTLFILCCGLLPLLRAQNQTNSLTLRVDPEYSSPNADGLHDNIFFYPVLQATAEPSRWRMEIKSGYKSVARLSGPGLPALIKWDGLGKKGERTLDGRYHAQLTVYGPKLHAIADVPFVIDTRPPLIQMWVSTPVFENSMIGRENLVFHPLVEDASPIDRWQIQIIDSQGQSMRLFWSTGPVQPVEWNGTDRNGIFVPEGKYRCVFEAWDTASNESAPFFLDVAVHVTAREMLQQTLHLIQVHETDQGLIVQLDAGKLFDSGSKRLRLSREGEDLLREIAILINAYQDVPVSVEGYSKIFRDPLKDRDRSSLYAWDVYSYVVKSGNVKASRLSVRGRGRSAMFTRRAANPPFIRNGVEVILQGNREW